MVLLSNAVSFVILLEERGVFLHLNLIKGNLMEFSLSLQTSRTPSPKKGKKKKLKKLARGRIIGCITVPFRKEQP